MTEYPEYRKSVPCVNQTYRVELNDVGIHGEFTSRLLEVIPTADPFDKDDTLVFENGVRLDIWWDVEFTPL